MVKGKKLVKNLTAVILSGIITVSLSGTVFARGMSLQESITEALNNNRSIKQEEASVEKSKAVLGEAQGERGVALTWTGSVSKLGGHYYNEQNIDHSYGNEIAASLPIYTGGQLENNVKSAKLGVEISSLTLENEKQSIELQTIQDYYSILNYQNIKKVDASAVEQYNEHLRVANAKYSAGVVPKSDVLEAEVNLANAQQSLVSGDNNLQVAITNFNKLIGQDLMTDVEPSDDYLTDTDFSKTIQECMDEAVQNRPDGIAAKKTVEQAQAAIAEAKAGYLPQVSAVASKTIAGDNMLNNDQSDKSLVGLQASWDIFDSNVTHSKVAQAQASLAAAQQQQADTDDQIRLDVRQAYLSMEAARKNINTTKTAVAQAAENNRIAEVRYQAGVGTNSDRLDAISYYITAQMNYNQALYDYTTSKAALYKAMGMSSESIAQDIAQATGSASTAADTEKTADAGLTASNVEQITNAGEENNSSELNPLDRGAGQTD